MRIFIFLSFFTTVINLTNDDAKAYYSRRINQKALGNTKEAKAGLEKALQLADQQGESLSACKLRKV